jgi:hypothetical protein
MARRQPDIRKLAKRLTQLLWVTFVLVLVIVGPRLPWVQGLPHLREIQMVLTISCSVAALIAVLLALIAEGNNVIIILVCSPLALIPGVNFFVLLAVISSAQSTLKRAGLRIGFLGVSQDQVERLLNPNLCGGCGYILTGNVTGICPECGHLIPRFCQYCGNSVLGTETDACPSCNQPIPAKAGVGG